MERVRDSLERIRKKKKIQERAWYQEDPTGTGAGQPPVPREGKPRQAAAARVDDEKEEGSGRRTLLMKCAL